MRHNAVRRFSARWVLASVGIAISAAQPGSAQVVPFLEVGDSVHHDLLELENQMMQAFADGDTVSLKRILGDDFVLTSATSTGEFIFKQGYIAGGTTAIKVESFRFHDVSIRQYGDVALVHCQIDWRSTWNGAPWNADFLMTDVWVRRDGRWQIVSRHSSYPGVRPSR